MKAKRNFRDFIYDHNDVLIAFLIIIAATAVIIWCVRNVMNYPNTLDSVTTAEEVQTAVEQESKGKGASNETAKWKDGKLRKTLTIEVASDSTEAAINSLITAGLFKTSKQFSSYCRKAGVSEADIKTGTFTFKKGSTRITVVKQVTE
ncbi:MAG: hypothetical protein IKF54_02505 [Eubacterium sp.]|nr:hypothetical protein [Eubacterium sp.]